MRNIFIAIIVLCVVLVSFAEIMMSGPAVWHGEGKSRENNMPAHRMQAIEDTLISAVKTGVESQKKKIGVYTFIPEGASYPFIFIGNESLRRWSRRSLN